MELTLCPTSSILYSSSVSDPLFVYYKIPCAVVMLKMHSLMGKFFENLVYGVYFKFYD